MEFIKTMKKREFIEMGLKTLAALLAAFLAIILMEGMIYGIKLNALKTKGTTLSQNRDTTILYCIEMVEDKYFVIACNPEDKNVWSAQAVVDKNGDLINNRLYSKAACEAMRGDTAKEVVFRAPNAFELSITGSHYIVMAVFVAAIAGFFTYKFIALSKEYKRIEEVYEKTGTIELG